MKVVLGAAGALIVAAAVIWFAAPGLVVKAYTAAEMRKAGLSQKSTTAGDHIVHYLEGGAGEHVVLLHGFGANKTHWLRFARFIIPGYHVVIPDLPGFGQSTYDETGDYSHNALKQSNIPASPKRDSQSSISFSADCKRRSLRNASAN